MGAGRRGFGWIGLVGRVGGDIPWMFSTMRGAVVIVNKRNLSDVVMHLVRAMRKRFQGLGCCVEAMCECEKGRTQVAVSGEPLLRLGNRGDYRDGGLEVGLH